MVEAEPKTAAETSLLLEQEIDKRVGIALAKLLNCPTMENCVENNDTWGFRWHLARELGEALVTDDTFRRKILNILAEQLSRP